MRRLCPPHGAALAGCILLVLAGCTAPVAQRPQVPPSASPSAPVTASSAAPSETPTLVEDRCLDAATGLSLSARIGQLIMVGVDGELDAAESGAITRSRVGSVVLLGAQDGGVEATARLSARLAGLNPRAGMLVAADQEGGLVQRLKGPGFSTIPSASAQAKLSTDQLRVAATGWGKELAKAGVDLDLAPVADVVPAAKQQNNAPIGRLKRGYGPNPKKVAASTGAVIAGLGEAGVGAAVKHFPGLGEVVGNTDHSAGVLDRVTAAGSASLLPFRSAAEAGVAAVMISSATYSRIDPKRQAIFSPKVIGLLRQWGYAGVVISDDLGAAASLKAVPASQRAVRFLAAGGDLVINASPGLTAAMVTGVKQRATSDTAFATQLTQSAARVLRLKAGLGLYDCG